MTHPPVLRGLMVMVMICSLQPRIATSGRNLRHTSLYAPTRRLIPGASSRSSSATTLALSEDGHKIGDEDRDRSGSLHRHCRGRHAGVMEAGLCILLCLLLLVRLPRISEVSRAGPRRKVENILLCYIFICTLWSRDPRMRLLSHISSPHSPPLEGHVYA